MLKIGDTVTMYSPGSEREHESWARGTIRRTYARSQSGRFSLHIVTINSFKWNRWAPWGPYEWFPEVLGREVDGSNKLEFVDTWPRRGRS
jgi:hypothetical protein